MHTLRTIVLDDHPPFRKSLRKLLSSFDFIKVEAEADSAEEALKAVEKNPPQLAIVDIRLPGMDGFEFTRILKGQFPQTRVIFVTLHNNQTYRSEAERMGLPYVLKESLLEELPRVLERL